MAAHRNFYEVLGVPEDASADAIQTAYRRLAVEYHPDKNPGDARAEERFKELAQAYAVLSDAEKRRVYDRQLKGGFATGGIPGFGGAGGFGGDWETFSIEEILRRYGDLFGGFGGFGRGAAMQRRGHDVEAVVNVPFRAAALGEKVEITLRGEGTPQQVTVRVPEGAEDGSTLRLRGMGGRGAAGGSAGDLFLRLRIQPDGRFRRRGRDVEADLEVPAPLAVLGGKVRTETLRGEATVTLPPGTSSGAVLRLRGQGIKGGDHLARVMVVVPETPTDEERELYRQLGDLAPE
ncbi:MAG: DnaJ C-terminal domain-containing protein [Planctomycetota bacterium]|jgi:curved DNA-binding protein